MTCQNMLYRDDLPEYASFQLSPARRHQISEHLDACDECRRELAVIESLAAEPVPEPSTGYWDSLPGRVTLSVKGKRHGTHRLPMAAWAGGLAAAALLVIFAVGPWKMQRTDMKLPGDYYIHMTENYSLGLVEEILAVSGLQVTDMDRALEQEIFLTGNPDYADPFEEAFQPDLYESMDETTMRMFEKLIEDITPAGVERG